MLILFASLNAIDGICCPDGCTHEQSSTSQHRTVSHPTPPASYVSAVLNQPSRKRRQHPPSLRIASHYLFSLITSTRRPTHPITLRAHKHPER